MLFSEKICQETKLTKNQLRIFAKNSPRKYRVYSIPKRTAGFRTIAHPSKKLKEIQRVCLKLLEDFLPIHSAAFAYKKNTSIKDNAKMHKDNDYILKMDFQNFFNSITPSIFWSKIDSLDVTDVRKEKILLEKLFFWQPSRELTGKLLLSVGAPTSPIISNFIAYQFDCAISEWCDKHSITYTRYADDLTFSTLKKDILFKVPRVVNAFLKIHLAGITINELKTKFSSKKHNRHVTGITITNDAGLSLGRQRKRFISHMIHQYSLGCLEPQDILSLKGYLHYAEYIEKGFIERMIKKYSVDLMGKLLEGVE